MRGGVGLYGRPRPGGGEISLIQRATTGDRKGPTLPRVIRPRPYGEWGAGAGVYKGMTK